ncbi:RICIN domain-containing protein [Nocardia sp. XZ_19_369]|uniref:RICIN domain-containing protein n=1 Tax=Nocardia sp. XZ_19_369 TaxID=2769487 RepID=UPI00188E3CAB|nr:RICIN domain-containing protein [Nocardia sp. XZ_19_369]
MGRIAIMFAVAGVLGLATCGQAVAAEKDLVPTGKFTIRNVDSGKCLEDSDRLQLVKCDTTSKNQQWTAAKVGNGQYKLQTPGNKSNCLAPDDFYPYSVDSCSRVMPLLVKSTSTAGAVTLQHPDGEHYMGVGAPIPGGELGAGPDKPSPSGPPEATIVLPTTNNEEAWVLTPVTS